MEAGIHPVHHRGIGAEIALQVQRLQSYPVETPLPGFQKQAHVGTAKTVDGLHAVAHHHDGARRLRIGGVVVAPAAGEQAQQLVLVDRGILELVHQDVLDTVVQAQRQFGGRLVVTQGL